MSGSETLPAGTYGVLVPNSIANTGDGARSSIRRGLRELFVLGLVAVFASFLLQTFVGRVYEIPSESMGPTLHGCPGCTGDRIVAEKVTYRFSDPRSGDVIVFRSPTSSWNEDYVSTRSDNVVVRALQDAGSLVGVVAPDEYDLVKRVIATGGQTVECCDDVGNVEVDGRPLDEPYVVSDFDFDAVRLNCSTVPSSGRCFGPVSVPDGNLWMMGDNRNHSADSRFHVGDEFGGTVPVDSVIGRARVVVLPPARWGLVH